MPSYTFYQHVGKASLTERGAFYADGFCGHSSRYMVEWSKRSNGACCGHGRVLWKPEDSADIGTGEKASFLNVVTVPAAIL